MELGFDRMYRVFKARELLRSPVDAGDEGPFSPLPEGVTEEATYPTIEDVFGLPPYPLTDGGDELAGAGESLRQEETIGELSLLRLSLVEALLITLHIFRRVASASRKGRSTENQGTRTEAQEEQDTEERHQVERRRLRCICIISWALLLR
jgi:hypothetical protein